MARKNSVLLPNLTPAEAAAERSRLYRDPPALERVEWVFRESNRAIGEDASNETRGTRAGTRMGGVRATTGRRRSGGRSTATSMLRRRRSKRRV
jgi:hypothetical protein